MQQGLNEQLNYQAVSEEEQSTIVLKHLAHWLGRCAARAAFNNHTQSDEAIH